MVLTNSVTTQFPKQFIQSGFLLQSGSSLSGNLLITGGQTCAGQGPVTGTANQSNVAFTMNIVGQTISMTATTAPDGSMSGNYTIMAQGCGQSQTGTWTGVQIKPLTGNFQGTLCSVPKQNCPANPFSISGTLTQSANTGDTSAALSGTVTVTGSSCLTTASITGAISGTAAVGNLFGTDGSQLGQFTWTLPSDANSTPSGIYSFVAHPGTPCSGGDHGTMGTVTLP
ncbi:MAG TPA: hypothetical protein VFA74_10720 [Terriglobales bacterium]|nr:hypothetical protein [Terriglobales bacterium]